jgi:hypothetical protein
MESLIRGVSEEFDFPLPIVMLDGIGICLFAGMILVLGFALYNILAGGDDE